MAASGFCNFATSSLNSAGTSSGGLAGWVFHTIGFKEPRAKLEPKWHAPLWSSIANTVYVSTCVSTLTKCMQANQTAPHKHAITLLSEQCVGARDSSSPVRCQRLGGPHGPPNSHSQKLKMQTDSAISEGQSGTPCQSVLRALARALFRASPPLGRQHLAANGRATTSVSDWVCTVIRFRARVRQVSALLQCGDLRRLQCPVRREAMDGQHPPDEEGGGAL